jgi:hypothetical protein
MAGRSVRVSISSHPLSREENGFVFTVRDGGEKIGELVVSKGGVRWKPSRKRDHHFASWRQFDSFMRDMPRR